MPLSEKMSRLISLSIMQNFKHISPSSTVVREFACGPTRFSAYLYERAHLQVLITYGSKQVIGHRGLYQWISS